jgi:hypothetical protein
MKIIKLLPITGIIILTLFATVLIVDFLYRHRPQMLKDITSDVSQRLMPPDRSKVAYLIRRYAFDLNFGVVVRECSDLAINEHYNPTSDETLFWSGDYEPDLTINWNERLKWSTDSSLLILTIDTPEAETLFVWAYDFNTKREIKDIKEIESLWSKRNEP